MGPRRSHEGGERRRYYDISTIQNSSLDVIDSEEDDSGGYTGKLSPITAREQRVTKARRILGLNEQQQDRGDQTDQAAAEDHTTTDVAKALRLLFHAGEPIARTALQRFHVKWYHCGSAKPQSLLRAAGAPPRACNSVLQVVQACRVCRPWKRLSQSHKLTFSHALPSNEEFQFDLLFRSLFEFGVVGDKGILIIHLIDCCIRWPASMRTQSRTTKDQLEGISIAWVNILVACRC